MGLQLDQLLLLFDDRGISYEDRHKNVSNKCVGVCCPFCNDNSFHLGIFKQGLNFTCWKCGASGGLFTFLREVLGLSWTEFKALSGSKCVQRPVPADIEDAVKTIMEDNSEGESQGPVFWDEPEYPHHCWDVSCVEYDENPLLRCFLRKRNFDVGTCIEYEAIVGTPLAESYANRLIFPVCFENEGALVAYQGRDMTERARSKYYATPGAPIKETLYQYDSVIPGGTVIVTEGVFDVWRLGHSAVATFGTMLSPRQRKLLVALQPSLVVFAWDSDAYIHALEEAKQLVPFVEEVRVLEYPAGEDPDSFGRERTLELVEQTDLVG